MTFQKVIFLLFKEVVLLYYLDGVLNYEGVHLAFSPQIFFDQVRSGKRYIICRWGRVQNKLKET